MTPEAQREAIAGVAEFYIDPETYKRKWRLKDKNKV